MSPWQRGSRTPAANLLARLALPLLAGAAVACQPTAPVERANAVYDSGETERGIEILATAVEADPSDPRLQFEYGKLLMRHNKVSLAVWPLVRAAESPEYREKASMLAARSLMEAKNNENAAKILTDLLEEDPDLEPALLLRAQARVKGHQEELALEDLDRILELRPDDFVILQVAAVCGHFFHEPLTVCLRILTSAQPMECHQLTDSRGDTLITSQVLVISWSQAITVGWIGQQVHHLLLLGI